MGSRGLQHRLMGQKNNALNKKLKNILFFFCGHVLYLDSAQIHTRLHAHIQHALRTRERIWIQFRILTITTAKILDKQFHNVFYFDLFYLLDKTHFENYIVLLKWVPWYKTNRNPATLAGQCTCTPQASWFHCMSRCMNSQGEREGNCPVHSHNQNYKKSAKNQFNGFFGFFNTLSLSGNFSCLTWVRLKQTQEQRYPVLQVHAIFVCVFIIHQTLSTGSLICVRDHSYACVYTQGLSTATSQHNIFDSEKFTFFSCAPDGLAGIQTSGLWIWVRRSTNWATPGASSYTRSNHRSYWPPSVCIWLQISVWLVIA